MMACETEFSSWTIERHQSIDSTMIRARARALDGAPSGTVVVSDFQTDGRGTRGRTWSAPVGTCLMFSFILRPTLTPAGLSDVPSRLAANLRDILIDLYDLDIAVKQPNDLVIGQRKLAGVLCQSHLQAATVQWLVCGIGLNTNLNLDQLQVPNSTSLQIETGLHVCHRRLLNQLLDGFMPLRQL